MMSKGSKKGLSRIMKKPRVAVVGSGSWGFNHVRTFNNLNTCELIGVSDLNNKNLERVRNQFPELKTTKEYTDFTRSSDIDAIVVSSSAETHYEISQDALVHGKHCLVEKPITLDIDEAQELVDLADQKDLVLMVGHLLLYHGAVDFLKKLVDEKKIGDMLYLYSQRVNLGKVRSNENALWSFAPHDISIMLYLIDSKPVRVSATGQSFLQKKKDIHDVVFFTIFFENGTIATGQVSWLDPHKIRKFTIVGSEKMVTFDDMEIREKIRIYDKGVDGWDASYDSYAESMSIHDGDISIPKVILTEPLKREDGHFIECIINKKKPLTGGQNGLDVLKVLMAAQNSLDNFGKPEDIL